MTDADRLFTRPATLTPDERARARVAFEATPAVLEALYRAALGDGVLAVEQMQAILGRVRCSAS